MMLLAIGILRLRRANATLEGRLSACDIRQKTSEETISMLEGNIDNNKLQAERNPAQKCSADLREAIAQRREALAKFERASSAAHKFELKAHSLEGDVARLEKHAAERNELQAVLDAVRKTAKEHEDRAEALALDLEAAQAKRWQRLRNCSRS